MREKIRASDVDWRALDGAQWDFEAAEAQRAAVMRAISAAADARAAEIERLSRAGVPLATIAHHLGISRQAVSAALTRYRTRRRDHT